MPTASAVALERKPLEPTPRERMLAFFKALSDSERLRWVHLIEMQANSKPKGTG